MKPLLKPAPLTPEDFKIFTDHGGNPIKAFWMGRRNVLYRDADRRDADLMHTRTHRMAFGCAVCWENIAHEACTIDHEIRLRRPFPKGSLGEFLRENLP